MEKQQFINLISMLLSSNPDDNYLAMGIYNANLNVFTSVQHTLVHLARKEYAYNKFYQDPNNNGKYLQHVSMMDKSLYTDLLITKGIHGNSILKYIEDNL